MKHLFLLMMSSLFCVSTFALPVVNENISPPGFHSMVVWRDHQDSSKLYVLPRGFRRESGYQWGFVLNKNVMNISFGQDFDMDNIYRLKDYYQKKAQYPSLGEVSFEDFNLNLGTMMDDFVSEKSCWNFVETMLARLEFDKGGLYVHCKFDFNETGMKDLIPFLEQGKFLAFNVSAKIQGMKQLADGSYEPVTVEVGFPVKFDYPKK